MNKAPWHGWSALVLVAGVLLVSVALGRLGFAARLLGEPGEREYGEAIIYVHAHRILSGEPLYQPLDHPPYTVVSYTPLYYGVAAGLQWLAGPGWMPGRLVSYIAALVSAILVGYLTWRATDAIRAGFLAAVLFVALGFPGGSDPWYALYKEDVLGVALSLAAITLLFGGTSRWRVVVSAVLAALALLTKQTFVAAALAGLIWLWGRDCLSAGVFIGVYLGIVLGTTATLELQSRAFVANTLLANVVPFSMAALELGLRVLLRFQAGALLIATGCVLNRWSLGCRWRDDLVQLYWAASFLPLVGLAKVGSNTNYWIELAASTAVLAILGVWDARRWRWLGGAAALLPGGVLLASVVIVLPTLGRSAVPVLSVAEAQMSQVADLGPVIVRIRAEPGPVLANPLDVLALAGKDILFEPYLFGILYTQGRWDPEPLIQDICAHRVRLVVLSEPLDSASSSSTSTYHGYSFSIPPILEKAVRESMTLDEHIGDRYLYRPAPADPGRPPPTACAGLASS